jgi:hypothetical protein
MAWGTPGPQGSNPHNPDAWLVGLVFLVLRNEAQCEQHDSDHRKSALRHGGAGLVR